MELRPLNESHEELLNTLQQQDDVWEFIGSSPLTAYEPGNHVFAIMETDVPLGFVGLFKTTAAGRDDFQILCATRSEVQHHGVAREACELVLEWGLRKTKLDRVIACIDATNHPARAIAAAIGMRELGTDAAQRIIYVKYRDKA